MSINRGAASIQGLYRSGARLAVTEGTARGRQYLTERQPNLFAEGFVEPFF